MPLICSAIQAYAQCHILPVLSLLAFCLLTPSVSFKFVELHLSSANQQTPTYSTEAHFCSEKQSDRPLSSVIIELSGNLWLPSDFRFIHSHINTQIPRTMLEQG